MNTEFLFIILLALTSQAIAKNVDQKCKPDICGPNAKCIDSEDDETYNKLKQPYCLCEPKTIGKPPNCMIGCLKNSDCHSDEFCDLENKACKKVCEHSCNSTDTCHDSKKLCIGKCRDHDDCKSNEICDISHTCVIGCRSDNSCKDNEHCNDESKCIDVCAKSNCGENSVCNGYNHITHCACEEGYIPEKGIGCKKKEPHHTFVELDELECHHFCGDFASCIVEDDIIHCYCPKELRSNPIIACPPPLLYATSKPEYCECCEQAIDPDCAVPISCALDGDCVFEGSVYP
ncbi:protein kinase C-binding protein NELL2a-like [Chironomus tepperi]|uniref:protein kinase C-binding protein NELL2a-like n=1 Tax=Chironomus tepperi TaxID=113505 RepID=UPI00391F4E3A